MQHSGFLRIWRVDVMNGHASFNGAKSKPSRLILLVFEDAYTAVLILQWAVNFLMLQNIISIQYQSLITQTLTKPTS